MPLSDSELHSALAPIIEDEALAERVPAPGVALCLSGGGYRAMVFHLGVLLRLNEFRYLAKLNRVSSVSGGSITAAMLGLKWGRLQFVDGVAQQLQAEVIDPIRAFARRTIDAHSVIEGLLLPGSVSDKVADAYCDYLFDDATLQDLPDEPRFVINATNVQTGALWRFSKPYMGDYLVGRIPGPTVKLGAAVAASSAFPPVLSPMKLKVDAGRFLPSEGEPYHKPPFTAEVYLSDGGVYDNLGLETAWKRYRTVLVSDAGMAMQAEPEPAVNWISHSKRVLDLIDRQVRALRKRQLLASLADAATHNGAYWGIGSDIGKYQVATPLECPVSRTEQLATVPTRLAELSDELQERLINWGYAICDAAMRRWVDPTLPPPAAFPFARGV